VLREALWRDIIGFIPVYACTLAFGLWFAATQLGWKLPAYEFQGVPCWIWAVLVTVVTDYLEDICHLHYLKLNENGSEPSLAETLFSALMSHIKLGLFLAAAGMVLWAVFTGSWEVLGFGGAAGWRGAVALLITAGSLSAVALTLIASLFYWLFLKHKKQGAA
jgi:hypothetical protein